MLQTLGRLADHFLGENFEKMIEDGKTLVQKIITTAIYSSEMKFFQVIVPDGKVGDYVMAAIE